MTINRFAELARVFAPLYVHIQAYWLCSVYAQTNQSHFIKLTMCLFSARSVHSTDERTMFVQRFSIYCAQHT